jgi:hypothetical protein
MWSIDSHVICAGGNFTIADKSQRIAARNAKPELVHCIKAIVSQLILNKGRLIVAMNERAIEVCIMSAA